MNYEPMWAVVDALRESADALEGTLKEVTGDRPAPEEPTERDEIELYNVVAKALMAARDGLHDIADREGHTVRRRDASRCRVFAQRCDRALDAIWKSANR
jgi:hypothetical protein